MNKEWTQEKFTSLTTGLREKNKQLDSILAINKKIKQFNWAYIHPYLLGADIAFFEERIKSNELTKKYVFEVFAWSFFDLKNTAYFIDAYCKERPYIKPFCHLIDQSVILCIQKDYAGAINTLIPAIEGSLRNYLVTKKGKKNEKIMKTEDLLKAFEHMKRDYISFQKRVWDGEFDEYKLTSFNPQQKKQLLKLNTKFIDGWMSIITDYFENNLYLDTRDGTVNDKLNRHSIFHGFTGDIYYNLENYLRVYNCLQFLCWGFAMADKDISILATLDHRQTLYKWRALEKIKLISDLSTQIKSSIYEKYADFNKQEFEEGILKPNHFDKHIAKIFRSGVESKLKSIDKLFDKHMPT